MAVGTYLYHCVSVRNRVIGTGSFQMALRGLDDINTQDLTTTTLSQATERYPNLLSNFTEQRMRGEFWVDVINDEFTLKQIQFFLKPVASGYPQ